MTTERHTIKPAQGSSRLRALAAMVLLAALSAPASAQIRSTTLDSDELRIRKLEKQVKYLLQELAAARQSAEFVAELQQHVTIEPDAINGLAGPHVIFTGANVHVRSGSGATDDGGVPTGLGNLLVGYDEQGEPVVFEGRHPCQLLGTCDGEVFDRNGSHNLVVGDEHTFTSYAGLVAGHRNTLAAARTTASGGTDNSALGEGAAVCGGMGNYANGDGSSVSGGSANRASGPLASVLGGTGNTASGVGATVSGGVGNHAEGDYSAIGGGAFNVDSTDLNP
jgi:hypothetical protein